MQKLTITVLQLAVLTLTACAGATLPPGGSLTTPSPSLAQPAGNVTTIPFAGVSKEALATMRAYLAAQTGVKAQEVTLKEIQETIWSDACLGAAQKDEMCAQVITPGFRIILDTPNGSYELHTNQDFSSLRLSQSTTSGKSGHFMVQWERSGGIAGVCYRLTVAMDGLYQLSGCQPGSPSREGLLPEGELNYLAQLAIQYGLFQWKVPEFSTGADMFADQYSFNGHGSKIPPERERQALNEHIASLVQDLLRQSPPESSGGGTGIEGLVTMGPTCPGPVKEGDTQCADKPYQAWITILEAGGGVVQRIQSDPLGHFWISLPPGTYILHPESTGVLPVAGDQTVSLRAGQVLQVTIAYDSGMR